MNYYYSLILNFYSKNIGLIDLPSKRDYPILNPQIPFNGENWPEIKANLVEGSHFDICFLGHTYVVSQELKQLLEENRSETDSVEFYPITVLSKEYGDRVYYVVYFPKKFDVIDEEHSVKLGSTYAKPAFSAEKVAGHSVVSIPNHTYALVVSNKIWGKIKRANLKKGMIALKIPIY